MNKMLCIKQLKPMQKAKYKEKEKSIHMIDKKITIFLATQQQQTHLSKASQSNHLNK